MAQKDAADDTIVEALERWRRAEERERANMLRAYEDLEFRAPENPGDQWPAKVRSQRELEGRPVLEFNRIPQFVRQVTNDIRLMRPSIAVMPVDSNADPDTADMFAGMIRYIENRSDAQSAYYTGADSQVTAGIGHWQVITEYAGERTFDQEIRIVPVDDGVAVLWDPDASLPTREDAEWCFQPIDLTHAAFKERYPDATFDDLRFEGKFYRDGWFTEDYVRIARYWRKKPIKRKLALMPDGSVVDLTDEPEKERFLQEQTKQAGQQLRVEERDGHKITATMISSGEVLEEEKDWIGSFIPVVPVLGEEVRIGRKVIRHGMIRYAQDAQRMYNYFQSLQAEAIALQPKAPWLVTETNVKKFEAAWQEANNRLLPFLPYEPDPLNGGAPPSRAAPAIASQGISEMIALAGQNLKDVIGIQEAGLGEKGNETSGRAILARQREGDVGMYTYVDNFARAIRHTGTILVDLIPKIYDTERMIRVMGEDGQVDLVTINREVMDPATGEMVKLNDVTAGAYDVVVKQGPGYTTKREEAKEGMLALLQTIPDVAPLILDLVAEAQDWPLSEAIAKRFKTLLPPAVQQQEAEESGEGGVPGQPGQQQPPPPNPQEQAQAMAMQAEVEQAQLKTEGVRLENEKKGYEAEAAKVIWQSKSFDLAQKMSEPQAQPNGNGQAGRA